MKERTLQDMIKKGEGKLSEYEYYLKCGTKVFPKLILSLSEEKNRKETQKLINEVAKENFLMGDKEKYVGGLIYLKEDCDFNTIRKLLDNGFEIVGAQIEILRGRAGKVTVKKKTNEIFVKEKEVV